MSSSFVGALLARDKLDRHRSFGAFGKPAYQSYVQLRAMLKSKRSDRFANYFAKPTVDADASEILWTAEVPGAARAWHDMSPQEQALHSLDLEVVRSGLLEFAAELRAQGGSQPGGALAFASLLEQAMKVPAQGNYLYLVGDQPVIAFWGFEDSSGRSVDPAAVAPQLAVPATAPPVLAATPVPPAVAALPRRWWWLWLALLLLLLLFLLLWRGCTEDGGFDVRRAITGPAGPEGAASTPLEGRLPAPMRPDSPMGLGSLPPAGGAEGGAQSADPVSPAGSQPEGSASSPSTGVPAIPPDKPDAPTKPGDPAASGAQPPSHPGPDTPGPRKEEPPKTDPTKPPKPAEMNLPDDPNARKKLGFLEGDWKAGDGLVDKKTNQPLDMGFKFGKDGAGEVTVRRADGSECRGSVQGKMNGGKLSIGGDQQIPCSGGGSYAAPKIECDKERGGQTRCRGVNRDGTQYDMDMQRP